MFSLTALLPSGATGQLHHTFTGTAPSWPRFGRNWGEQQVSGSKFYESGVHVKMETTYHAGEYENAEEDAPLALRNPMLRSENSMPRQGMPAMENAVDAAPMMLHNPVLRSEHPAPHHSGFAPGEVEDAAPLMLRTPATRSEGLVSQQTFPAAGFAEDEAPMVLRTPQPQAQSPQLQDGVTPPKAPGYVNETGLEESFLLDLLVKTMYRQNQETATDLAEALCLVRPIIEELILLGRDTKLIESMGQLGASFSAEMRYALTVKGKGWAAEALANSEWVGPCPVTLETFQDQTKRQSIRERVLSEQMLLDVFKDLTLAPDLTEQLGPAVNSGASILLYGPPGNGKSSIASAICNAYQDHIFLPHAIMVDKQIIALFDTAVHTRVDMPVSTSGDGIRRGEGGIDTRFVRCERPQVETGGELTQDQLDLRYNPVSRIYEAPLQMKAAGGVLVIDDFGRQRQSPQELINRLIIPLEKRIDYLSLMTGRKFEVPFDTLTIFSTNIPPKELVDEAALRRLRYKILVAQPDQNTYLEIFVNTAREYGLEITEDVLSFVLFDLYDKTQEAEMHAFHPRFLIEQTKAICTYKGVPPQLKPEFLQKAWRNLFTEH